MPDHSYPSSSHEVGRLREELLAALVRVAESGWYVHGPEHEAFQDVFADSNDVGHCVGVASGTDALELALRAVGQGRDGIVLTTANAGGYATTAASRAGFDVSYADVTPTHLCPTATDRTYDYDASGWAFTVVRPDPSE